MTNDSLKMNFQKRISQLSSEQKKALIAKLSLLSNNASAKLVAYVTMSQAKAVDNKILKDYAQSVLPGHFVPQVFMQVEAIPRTSMGKIKRKKLQEYPFKELIAQATEQTEDDDGFDIFGEDAFGNNSYAAPSNETEAILAKIWSDVLSSGDISIHDEFLEVGGDSLLSIRILARINKAGLNIATEDFFEFPTIAGQAKAISKARENSYEQGSTKGSFELIPIQHWLFERIKIDPQQWNQSILLDVDEKLDFVSLERAFQKIVMHHDALRTAFVQDDAKHWRQEYLPSYSHLVIDHVDCTQETPQAQTDIIEQHCQSMNRSMSLSEGNLVRLAFFETQMGIPNKLVIAVHHLIIDAESWHILLEDLQSCWSDYAEGKTPALPRKTTSFKHWSEKLVAYAQSEKLNHESTYWQAQTTEMKIPLDFEVPEQANTVGSGQLHTVVLNKEMTSLLLSNRATKHKRGLRDLLVTSLVTVLHKWTNSNDVIIDIEGHGRESIFERVDISRTIGWFTTVFPVLFHINPNTELVDRLEEISNTLSVIPNKGIGHGVLREYRNDNKLKRQAFSEVCFNYLGQLDSQKVEGVVGRLNPIASNIGEPRSEKCLRAFYIEVNAKIEHEQLYVDWSYSQQIHKAETIEKLATEFIHTLTELLNIEIPAQHDEDDLFDLVDLEEDELDAIARALSGDS